MIAVIQRVSQAKVAVNQKLVSQINSGFLVFLGVVKGDTDKDLNYLVHKISHLRIMADKNQKMNLSLKQVKGEVLVVSQFTLAGNCQKGHRPSFIKAADPQIGEHYYQKFIQKIKDQGIPVKTGSFGQYMDVTLTNDGPVTIITNSQNHTPGV